MKYTIQNQLSDHVLRIEKDGVPYLAFQIAGNKRPDANRVQTDRKQDIGLIVKEDGEESWKPSFNIEKDETIYTCGPDLQGEFLSQIMNHPDEKNLVKISALLEVLERFKTEKRDYPVIDSHSVLFLDDGGIFFLPPSIISRQSFFIKESESRESSIVLHNPDTVNPEDSLSFTLAVLVYQQLTGAFPFTGTTSEEVRDKIRLGHTQKACYLNHGVKPEISDQLHSVFRGQKILLKDWRSIFSEYNKSGWYSEISSEQELKLKQEGERRTSSLEKSYKRRIFFRKYRTRLLVSAGLLIFIGSLAWTMLSNILAPPITVGMEPGEVVQLYYDSINNFDPVTMEDCFTEDAGKNAVSEATFLYVTSKIRVTHEGETGYVMAQEWIDSGRPSYNPKHILIGVANLDIQQTDQFQSEEEQTVTYKVEYDRWIPDVPDDIDMNQTLPPKSLEFHQIDRIKLRFYEDYWAIYELEVLEYVQADTIITDE